MNFHIESPENWQKVMMFIGQNIDYEHAYLPNLPMWAAVFDGKIHAMKLIVGTQRNDKNEIVACCVRQVYTDSVATARQIKPDFQPIAWLGDFGAVSPELSDYTEQVAQGYVQAA